MARESNALPLAGFVPGQVHTFEYALNDMWDALRACSVDELKMLRPTGKFRKLVDAMIDVRSMMDGGVNVSRGVV